MTDHLHHTLGTIAIDARGRIRTATRSHALGASLRQRRAWYSDPPPDDPAPVDPPPDDKAGKGGKGDDTSLTDEQQKHVNKLMANTRKEAEDRARKAFLKDLGLNPDDPGIVDLLKGKLTIAEQAEKEKADAEEKNKTELQKVQERVLAAEKERDEAKKRADEIEAKRRDDKLDSRLQALATAERAIDPADVVVWLRANKGAEVTALMDADEKVNEADAKKLLEEVRKAKAHWFQGARGVGTGSHTGGISPGADDKAAREESFKRQRRYT